MRSLRFSIAGLMGTVLLVALGTAALRYSSETMAAAVSLLTCGVLCLAVVGAVSRRGAERIWWLGFALFGWSYLGAPARLLQGSQVLASQVVLKLLAPFLLLPVRANWPFNGDARARWFFWIGHDVLALLAAIGGGLLAGAIFGAAEARSAENTTGSQPGARVSAKWWITAAVIVLSALALAVSAAIACARLDSEVSAGLAYLLTWWLIGLAALGALLARGPRREFWLGATFFGAGFMLIIFNHSIYYDQEYPRPYEPTVEMLNALRPRFAELMDAFSASNHLIATNGRIARALDERVPIQVDDETTLEEFIKYVQSLTRRPNGDVIPIYVDPIGLQEAEKTMASTLEGIQLEGVALGTGLRLGLRQLGLAYVIRNGMLWITALEDDNILVAAPSDDPYQIVGHCLLAIVAAGLGGLAAPLVCGSVQGRGRATQ